MYVQGVQKTGRAFSSMEVSGRSEHLIRIRKDSKSFLNLHSISCKVALSVVILVGNKGVLEDLHLTVV